MTDAEKAVLEAAHQYAEALKQTWNESPDYSALKKAETDLIFAAVSLVPVEEWKALRRAIRYG